VLACEAGGAIVRELIMPGREGSGPVLSGSVYSFCILLFGGFA